MDCLLFEVSCHNKTRALSTCSVVVCISCVCPISQATILCRDESAAAHPRIAEIYVDLHKLLDAKDSKVQRSIPKTRRIDRSCFHSLCSD